MLMNGTILQRRIAIYARYSTELQNPLSITDQFLQARRWAESQGWIVVAEYSDDAMTGAFDNRPGYQKMMEDSKQELFNVIYAEGIDRFSRDPADINILFRSMTSRGIEIHTRQEGLIDQLKASIIGYMAGKFRQDLAIKVRRGQEGCILAGKFCGKEPYGYDYNRELVGPKRINHGLVIKEDEAEIVRRIYLEYINGASPREIARRLNNDGIRRNNGKRWLDTAIRGNRRHCGGILGNPIYRGLIQWGRRKKTYNYEEKTKGWTLNDRDKWVLMDAPHLQIVSDDLWNAAQAKAEEIKSLKGDAEVGHSKASWTQRRPKYLLTSKMICGCCGAKMAICNGRIRCSSWIRGSGCDNRVAAKVVTIEQRLFKGLIENLLSDGVISTVFGQYQQRLAAKVREIEAGNAQSARELARLERQRDHLVDRLAEGATLAAVKDRIMKLESEIAILNARGFRPIPKEVSVEEVLARYRDKLNDFVTTLQASPIKDAAVNLFRPLINKLIMTPEGKSYRCELFADLKAISGGVFTEDCLEPFFI
jgi:site-specific DNA recombinase